MGYWLVTELKFVTNQTNYSTGCIYTFPSFYGRFSCPSTILIMPSLSHDPTAIEAPIILDCSHAQLVVKSKPARLNMRSGSDDIGWNLVVDA